MREAAAGASFLFAVCSSVRPSVRPRPSVGPLLSFLLLRSVGRSVGQLLISQTRPVS